MKKKRVNNRGPDQIDSDMKVWRDFERASRNRNKKHLQHLAHHGRNTDTTHSFKHTTVLALKTIEFVIFVKKKRRRGVPRAYSIFPIYNGFGNIFGVRHS